jgi:hypothetical protein
MSGDRQRCPHCGVESEYFTHEYYLPQIAESAAEATPAAEPIPHAHEGESPSDASSEMTSGDLEALPRARGPRSMTH